MVGGAAAGVVLPDCAIAGSIRHAIAAVTIKALVGMLIWSPLAPLVDCLPIFRATTLNTRPGRMLRTILDNLKPRMTRQKLLRYMNRAEQAGEWRRAARSGTRVVSRRGISH